MPRRASAAPSRSSLRGRVRRSSSATARGSRRPTSWPPRSAAARSRPTSRRPTTPSGWSKRRVTSTCSSTTPGLTRDGLLARMSDEDWRVVLETNLSSVFYTCRAVTRPMMKKRAGVIVNVSSIVGRARELGADELRGLQGGDHRLHQVARARAGIARTFGRTWSRPATCETQLDARAARGGDAGDDLIDAAWPVWRRLTKSPGRYAFSAPTTPRSSRARYWSSTVDWGCSGNGDGRRRVVITGLGMVSSLGNDVDSSWAASWPGGRAPPRFRRSTTPTTTCTSPAS